MSLQKRSKRWPRMEKFLLLEIRQKRFYWRQLSINEVQGKIKIHPEITVLNGATGVENNSNNEFNIDLRHKHSNKACKTNWTSLRTAPVRRALDLRNNFYSKFVFKVGYNFIGRSRSEWLIILGRVGRFPKSTVPQSLSQCRNSCRYHYSWWLK